MPDYIVNYTPPPAYTINYTPNVYEVFVSDGGARVYTDLSVAAHNALATAHTAVAHVWTEGQTFQANIDVGLTSVGENGAIAFGTGMANIWWGFVFSSAGSSVPAYVHSVGGWGINIPQPGRSPDLTYPQIAWGLEGRYWNGSAYVAEVYIQYTPVGGAGAFRPISITVGEASPYATQIDFSAGTVNLIGQTNANGINIVDGNIVIYNPGYHALMALDTTSAMRNLIGFSGGDQINIGDGLHNAKFGYTVCVTRNLMVANADPTWDHGDGVGLISIKNASVVPTANVATGGLLYCEAGALKYRGSGGKVTTLADAA